MDDTLMEEGEPMVPPKRSSKERRMRLEKVGTYRIGRTLGRGNFAVVKLAYHELANSKVAMKIVDKQNLDPENLAKIDREIQILQKLNHPYIVKLYEVIRTERYLYIITDYIGGGELFDMLMDKGKQSEDEARRLFQQIVSAVAYCHASGVVHRDLKAENLLLDKENNIKLIDFGFSNYQKNDSLLSTWCGSPPYAAPELLLGQEYDGRMSDVWSLGVVLYILVTAGFPFPGDSVDKLKRAVLADHLKIPFWVSVECADLIRKMLTVSLAKRYSLSNVIQHRWFTSKMPTNIKNLLKGLTLNNKTLSSTSNLRVETTRLQKQLDPTVMLFMMQNTGWSEVQIGEDVLNQNSESPIYATYELLNEKLAEFKDGSANHIDHDHPRRGSRGSILSGKAVVEPGVAATTIPAAHLAKLNLSTTGEFDSDDSSASDQAEDPSSSPRYAGGVYGRRRLRWAAQDNIPENYPTEQRRHTLCAAGIMNPLLAAAAQPQLNIGAASPFAWANAAAMALATMQLQRQVQAQQEQLNSYAALAGLSNMPLVDYTRGMKVPQPERRASANEAMLGLNNYAHLLAACSTIGTSGTDQVNGTIRASLQPQPQPSFEEEGESYLEHYGSSKRNTVHMIAGMSQGGFSPNSSQRHRTPFYKQNSTERRSSWAAAATNTAPPHISPQQHAQLERLYRQSIAAQGSSSSASEQLTGVQQLQMEFQKLCASAETNGPQRGLTLTSSNTITPTISITDEHNRSLLPTSNSHDPLNFQIQGNQSDDTSPPGFQRPATVIGFSPSSSASSSPENPHPPTPASIQSMDTSGTPQKTNGVKFVFIPVSISIALERLKRFIVGRNIAYEVSENNEADTVQIKLVFEDLLFMLNLYRMAQSPNISKAEFSLVRGENRIYERLRSELMAIFNEVC
uniref:non-specific serine/threonine protein kinase n=1 Tax=Acrobeloides nanus TaxID=290746 RepID=A0A914D6B2_9BILA